MPVHTSVIPVSGVKIPALYSGDPSSKIYVIVLHGLGVSKEVQIPELQRLMAEGFFAIAFDAPHHGDREDGFLGIMERMPGEYERHLMLLKIIVQHAAEVESLVRFYQEQGKKVAVVGISMGGFTAFATLLGRIKPDFCAPFLASPDFRSSKRPENFPETLLEKCGPADKPEVAFPTPMLIVNAGKDDIVSPKHSEKYYLKLQESYKESPELLDYQRYDDSEHFMKASDWYDAWEKLLYRLHKLES
ncbi:MAG: hypothetical protein Kow0029_09160 [Candidatus Rifleibacteriota bacterium]